MSKYRQSGAGLWAGVVFWFIIVLILIFGLKMALKKDSDENNKTSNGTPGGGGNKAGAYVHAASAQSPVPVGIYTAGAFLQY